jgi:transcriptional regulator with XRE-family HTH domain
VDAQYEKILLNIGNRIKTERLAKNLTQSDLASMIDCEIKSIQRIEKGKMNMSLRIFLSLSDALNIPPEKLLITEDNE